jgi:hypothetical protein
VDGAVNGAEGTAAPAGETPADTIGASLGGGIPLGN